MKKLFIKDLETVMGQEIEEYFFVKKIEPVVKGANNTYLDIILSDKTGEIKAKVWNDHYCKEFIDLQEQIIILRGTVGLYQGREQITITTMERANLNNINCLDYSPAFENIDNVVSQIMSFVNAIKKPHIKALIHHFFNNEKFMKAFKKCQGGVSMHHTMIGGLPVHTLGVLRGAMSYLPIYHDLDPYNHDIDGNILSAACILHDIGKLKEYKHFPINKRTTNVFSNAPERRDRRDR